MVIYDIAGVADTADTYGGPELAARRLELLDIISQPDAADLDERTARIGRWSMRNDLRARNRQCSFAMRAEAPTSPLAQAVPAQCKERASDAEVFGTTDTTISHGKLYNASRGPTNPFVLMPGSYTVVMRRTAHDTLAAQVSDITRKSRVARYAASATRGSLRSSRTCSSPTWQRPPPCLSTPRWSRRSPTSGTSRTPRRTRGS